MDEIKELMRRNFWLQERLSSSAPKSIRMELTPELKVDYKLELKRNRARIKELENPTLVVSQTALSDVAEARQSLRDPQMWVRKFCLANRVDVHSDGMLILGKVEKHQTFANICLLQYMTEVERCNSNISSLSGVKKVEPVRADVFSAALQLNYTDMKGRHLKEHLSKIKHDPSQDDHELRRWLSLMVGNDNKSFDMYLGALKHSMQCVKRKMLGLPTDFHLFVVFFGRQGDGKTVGLRVLTRCMRDFVIDLTVDQLSDTTITGCFEENYIVICDEMARATKTDKDMVKRMVTAERINGRPPYGARLESIKQNCTSYGTSNEAVKYLIKDKDMRRFVEVKTIMRSEEDYAAMDGLDSLKMWRCIDELAQNSYYHERKGSIKLHQASLCTQDPIEVWAEEFQVVPVSDYREQPLHELYDHYTTWLHRAGYEYTTNIQAFGEKLQHELSMSGRKFTIRGKKLTAYRVNGQCSVPHPTTDVEFELAVKSSTIA